MDLNGPPEGVEGPPLVFCTLAWPHGPWPLAPGPWPLAPGPWPKAHGPWPSRCTLRSLWSRKNHLKEVAELGHGLSPADKVVTETACPQRPFGSTLGSFFGPKDVKRHKKKEKGSKRPKEQV